MELSKIDNVVVCGVDPTDYPDFCDAYIESADYDGVPMTEEQLDELNINPDLVLDLVYRDLW